MDAKTRSSQALVFAAGVFVSAFLLFQVQPLISKAILPWFGGTPSVWTTCMLFFQVLLCLGYAYAHVLTSRLSLRWQGTVHVAVLALALAVLNVLPGDQWKPAGDESPALQILLLLAASVGLPYFILSSTGPLLQRWFTFAFPGRSPYRLYSLSNVGSLLALLSYPFVFEPALTMPAQSTVWSAGFWLFAVLCSLCALQVARVGQDSIGQGTTAGLSSSANDPKRAASATAVGDSSVHRSPMGLWFLLAMVGSTMFLAITNEVCQDVAVVPFLWVVPLSLYLLTFILCFDSRRWYWPRFYALATAFGVAFLCLLVISHEGKLSIFTQALLHFGLLFCSCMLCHGELARRTPDPAHLTTFYLIVAAGGAAGGLFVGLIAPLIFPQFWELYIALLACVLIAVPVGFTEQGWLGEGKRPPLVGVVAAISLLTLVGVVFAEALTRYSSSIAITRNFYGVLNVDVDSIEDTLVLYHGRIIHGVQYRDPALRRIPTAYYGVESGIGRTLNTLHGLRGPLRIGVVGLGVGTLAAYGQPGDVIRFYEINDDVIRLARALHVFKRLGGVRGDGSRRCPAVAGARAAPGIRRAGTRCVLE